MLMATKATSQSYATLAAIAALAFIVACVAHGAVGHGGICLGVGGHVALLTSIYFGSPSTDVAQCAFFCGLAMAFNLFWGAGYLIYSAVTNSGDYAFVLRDLALEPNWV
jgi:hypothetical protein